LLIPLAAGCASHDGAGGDARGETSEAPRDYQLLAARCRGEPPPTTSTDPPSLSSSTATALIDRIARRAEILTIEDESYRRRVAEATRRPSKTSA
jgi:hypothetical protein